MSEKLSQVENATMGLLGGALEVSCFQSLNYLKNASQQNLPLTLDPRKLYRGYPSNLLNMGSCTMWQFTVMSGMQKLLLQGENRSLSDTENLVSGMVAGMSSGLLGGPAELMMIQQQVKGGSFAVRAKEIGPTRVLRGFFPCAMREGMWTVGYLSLPPLLRRKIMHNYGGSLNEEFARVGASLFGAFLSCLVSHPFDTVKTCMQGDIEKKKYTSTIGTFRTIYSESGVAAFYRGTHWRYLRQFLAIFLLDKVRSDLTPIIFPHSDTS
mmetsp:Transcript_21139/g.41930  ORF Transcript_21139/g.41930 Transcript_21139/m.41930 type:complete len:267 (-) Transcript_21139:17-817(-)